MNQFDNILMVLIMPKRRFAIYLVVYQTVKIPATTKNHLVCPGLPGAPKPMPVRASEGKRRSNPHMPPPPGRKEGRKEVTDVNCVIYGLRRRRRSSILIPPSLMQPRAFPPPPPSQLCRRPASSSAAAAAAATTTTTTTTTDD